jgi:MFS family permease
MWSLFEVMRDVRLEHPLEMRASEDQGVVKALTAHGSHEPLREGIRPGGIVVGYTLVVTVFVLNAGRLADMFGRTRTYTLGLVVFTAASAFCAIAPDPLTLILGRVVQGVGGAFMFANSSALVTDAFPTAGRTGPCGGRAGSRAARSPGFPR